MSQRFKQVFMIAIAIATLAGTTAATADFKGTDEELAHELGVTLEKLASFADSFYDGIDGEALEETHAIIDWLGSLAGEIVQRFEKREDSAGLRRAQELAEAAQDAQGELRKYAKDQSTPKVCEKALREVLEIGRAVVKTLGSKR